MLKFDKKIPKGSISNYQWEITMHCAMRWLKCKLNHIKPVEKDQLWIKWVIRYLHVCNMWWPVWINCVTSFYCHWIRNAGIYKHRPLLHFNLRGHRSIHKFLILRNNIFICSIHKRSLTICRCMLPGDKKLMQVHKNSTSKCWRNSNIKLWKKLFDVTGTQ